MAIYLKWFRDQGRGQEASTAVKAVESVYDGIPWPVAVVNCTDRTHANEVWEKLYREFGVNAMTYITEDK